ncbi:PASTA domain-containing protein [bacterium]|nr:PASTA domain-containing protein [Bacteroides sp.]MBD5387003.1 PASTA domain-containing protein [bacterium]
MEKDSNQNSRGGTNFVSRHPVIFNIVIIAIIAFTGLYIVYLALAIFTKHGESDKVPNVENMTYTKALELLHDRGFRVDIRDSVYRDDVKPGLVIEQFPKSNSMVKPGRKIFLYINAVHPKEVILDDVNHPNEFAMKGVSYRTALAKFEELGFKNVRVVKVLGATDRVVKVLANGRPVRKMQKVPVNAMIVLEVADGRLADLRDSLQNEELRKSYMEGGVDGDMPYPHYIDPDEDDYSSHGSSDPAYTTSSPDDDQSASSSSAPDNEEPEEPSQYLE